MNLYRGTRLRSEQLFRIYLVRCKHVGPKALIQRNALCVVSGWISARVHVEDIVCWRTVYASFRTCAETRFARPETVLMQDGSLSAESRYGCTQQEVALFTSACAVRYNFNEDPGVGTRRTISSVHVGALLNPDWDQACYRPNLCQIRCYQSFSGRSQQHALLHGAFFMVALAVIIGRFLKLKPYISTKT